MNFTRLPLKSVLVTALGFCLISACATAQESAVQSQDQAEITTAVMTDLGDFSCRDLVLLSGEDRDLSVSFLLGFSAGKSGSTMIDSESLSLAGELLLEECVDNPTSPVLTSLNAVLASIALVAES